MNSRDQIERRIKRLNDTGQTMHCPDCGHGFPVTDPGTGAVLEKMAAVVEAARKYHACPRTDGKCDRPLCIALAALDSE